MSKLPLLRQIAELQLDRFAKPVIDGNRGVLWRSIWYLVSALFFQSAILSLLPGCIKAQILRIFGARVGRGFVCKPRVNIKYPWFLSIGNHCWLGEGVWIDNVCTVELGSNVCLSQGVAILTGSHDWSRHDFHFFSRSVVIGDGVWVTAFRIIRPGVTVPPHRVVLADLSLAALRVFGSD